MQKLDDRVVQQVLREEEIDLRHFATVIGRRKWSILGLALLAAIAAALITFMLQPIYRGSATVLVESQEANVVTVQDIFGLDTRGQQYFDTQFEILKSRPLAEKVVKRLNLLEQPEFNAPPPLWKRWWRQLSPKSNQPVNPTNALVDRYLDILDVTPTPKTQLVKVSFDSNNPALAAAIANAHAQAYIESHLEAKEAMTRSASEWMTSRLDELKKKLTESEQRLQAFKESEHLVDVDTGIQALPAHELSELTTKLVEARRELSENRNAFDQVNQAQFASLDAKLAIPAVNADPLIKQFRQARAEAELQVAELAKRYGPLHPKMKAALSTRDAAEASLANHIESVMDSIRNQQDVLKGQAQAIAAAMNDTKADVQSVGRKEAQYRSLQQEAETNRQLYDLFYKRIGETKETGNLATPNARVIEPAEVPSAPVKPKKALIVTLVFIAALIVGVVSVLIADAMNTTLATAEDVERKIGVALLGLVPIAKRRRKFRKHIGREYFDSHDHKFDEAIRTLRTAITLSNLDAGHKTIMVTSSCGDEGKTSIACNLALAFAQLERVLLIDADLRRASVAAEFQIDARLPGLAELCAGTVSPTDCISRIENCNLDILVAGEISANPQELFSSPRLQEVLGKLKAHYDRIIIDTSPVLPVSDALLLANRVDALVYVIKADSTTTAQVRSGLQLFRRTPIAVKGVILNQVNLKKSAEYGSAYSYGNYELRGSH